MTSVYIARIADMPHWRWMLFLFSLRSDCFELLVSFMLYAVSFYSEPASCDVTGHDHVMLLVS